MQPLTEYFGGFKNLLPTFLSGGDNSTQDDNSNAHHPPLCSTAQTSKPDETIYPTYEVPDSDDEVQVAETAARKLQYVQKPQGERLSKKRAAEQITAKQRSGSGPSADALRLSDDYIHPTPRDAKPINAPSYDSDWNPPPPERSEANVGGMYRPGHSGHKFGNTLSRPAPHATKRASHDPTAYKQTSAGKQERSLGLQSSRGRNVARPPTFVDDGIVEEPPLKRARKGNSPVDLTLNDSIEEVSNGARANDRGRRASPSLSRSSNANASARSSQDKRSHFENNEMHDADSMIKVKSALKRTGAGRSTAQTARPTGSSQAPLPVDENRPRIDLGRGLDNIGQQSAGKKQKAVQGSLEDKINTQAVFDNFAKKPGPRRRDSQHFTTGEPSAIAKARPTRSQQTMDTRLGTKSRRDDKDGLETVSLQGTTAADQSRGSGGWGSSHDDSEDELHGDNTRIAKGRQSTSPIKKVVPGSEVSKWSSKEPSQEPMSSRYKLSNLISHKQAQTTTAGPDDFEPDRFSIRRLFSRRFSSHDEGLRLIWHHARDAFLLHNQDGSLATSGFDDKSVSIGRSAVSQGFFTTPLNTKAVLKGSTSPTNPGPICIEFESIGAKNDCFDMLDERHKINLKITEDEWFENMYKKQSDTEFAEFRRLKDKQPPAHAINTHGNGKRARAIGDEIQYESEEHPEQAIATKKQRTRMQVEDSIGNALEHAGYHQPRAAQQQIQSPYFEKGERRSSRRPQPARYRDRSPEPLEPSKWTKENNSTPWPRSVVYPTAGTRRVTVDFKDLERLDEGEFLNDNVINYALREIEESMEPKHREKVHFFNTFFYTSVSTDKNGAKVKECNYDAVKKWTKSVDLFNKPYVVVPINLDLHWFVAIICNLDKVDRKTTVFDDLVQHSDDTSFEGFDDDVEMGGTSSKPVEQEGAQATSRPDDDSETDGGAIATDAKSEVADSAQVANGQSISASSKKSKKKTAPGPRKYETDSLVIASLDSFGIPRSAELRVLRQYISKEAEQRRGIELPASDLQGMKATKIPEQSNFYDCGVYLVGYLRAFAKDPERFVHKILRREPMEEEFSDFDSAKIRVEIREKLLALQTVQEEAHRAQKKAKREGAKTAQKAADFSTATKMPATQASVAILKADAGGSAAKAETPSKAQSLPATIAQQTETRSSARQAFDGGSSQPLPSETAAPTSQTLAAEEEDDLEVAAPDTLPNKASITNTRVKHAHADNVQRPPQERARLSTPNAIGRGSKEDGIDAPNDQSVEDDSPLSFLHKSLDLKPGASGDTALPNRNHGFTEELWTPEGAGKEASGVAHVLESDDIPEQILEVPDSQRVQQAPRPRPARNETVELE